MCEASKTLYNETAPYLYRQFAIQLKESLVNNVLPDNFSFVTLRPGLLTYAENFILRSEFHREIRARCMHRSRRAIVAKAMQARHFIEHVLSCWKAGTMRTLE